jgi:hypothetical protein
MSLTLSEAARIAHRTLASRPEREVANGLLDVVAIALATWMPVYAGEARRRVSEEELAQGRFRHGASLLQFKDGRPALDQLSVERADLDSAIRQLELAGVSFSQAWPDEAPRRVPRVMPA